MDENITTIEPIEKENFFIARIKKYQIISFTLFFLFLNQMIVLWFHNFTDKEKIFENILYDTLFYSVIIPLSYFLQWLIIVWVASKFPREKLKEKFSRHPMATIILFVLFIADLPYRLSDYWGGNPASIFEVVVYYSFVSFLWWLLVCWISEKIFKKQQFQWNWYKKIIDKVFVILPPLYKFIVGLLAALLIFVILFLLIARVFNYSGSDLRPLFKH